MVDVIPGAPPVRIALATFRSVMDTVKVTASRLYDRDRTGFQGRSRSGTGQYVTAEVVLTNTDEGNSWTIATKIERPFRSGWYASGSYLYGRSRTVMILFFPERYPPSLMYGVISSSASSAVNRAIG